MFVNCDPKLQHVMGFLAISTMNVQIAMTYMDVIANDAERNQHEMSANIPDQIDGTKRKTSCYGSRVLLILRIDTQDTTASRPDGFASGPNGASQAGLLYPHRAARSWPSFRPGYLRGDNGMTAETSMRLSGTVPVSRTELRIVSVNATWHEEIDAHVEKERLDWAEERPYPAGCVRD